jgi:hypothetical protein
MVEDWLSLSNDEVHSILIESARPRTRELYSKELIMFLARGIQQNFDVSTDFFSKMFYVPLMKSLNNMLNLHDLLSQETSNHSNNTSKMPSTSYGTKESPGHIQLWISSLANQKDAILQWLGKDELVKHKTVESAVKYIRSKLMEARTQSEARQDLDAKLTPIRYDEVIHTQAESYQKRQINQPTRPLFKTPDNKFADNRPRSTFSALYTSNFSDDSTYPLSSNKEDTFYDDDDNYDDTTFDEHLSYASDSYPSVKDISPPINTFDAVSDVSLFRSAIAATFRGYCCELFVFGTCTKRSSGCTYDHSAAGQEMCINSFVLLSKRDLTAHTQLPPYQQNNVVTTRKPPLSQSQYSRSNNQGFTQPRTYSQPALPSTYSNSHHSGGHSILRDNNKFGTQQPSLTVMNTEDIPPTDSSSNDSSEPSAVFDPDHILSHTLLTQLASATSVSSQELCQPFLRNGRILTASSTEPILFDRFLLDTGAQGSNFISAQAYFSSSINSSY